MSLNPHLVFQMAQKVLQNLDNIKNSTLKFKVIHPFRRASKGSYM